MGYAPAARPLFVKAGIADGLDEGVIQFDAAASIERYVAAANGNAYGRGRLACRRATHDCLGRNACHCGGHFPFRGTRFIRGRPLQRFAREVGEYAFARAGACDEDGAYPAADVAALRESALITAVFFLESDP